MVEKKNYWVFVAKDEDSVSDLRRGVWHLFPWTKYRKQLRPSDHVVFYRVGRKVFWGTAIIDSVEGLTVRLKNVRMWRRPVPAGEVVSKLALTKGRRNWGAFFQSGVVKLGKGDYELLMELGKENIEG